MSHEIDMSNGRANMAYVGEKPWHGLGHELEPDAPLDEWRIAAGLNWEINRAPVKFDARTSIDEPISGLKEMFGRDVLYRSDTHAPLSIVSNRYKVVQPEEILEFYRDLIDCGDFKMETAGVLHGGKKIWALARTNDEVRLLGQDLVESYLLLATACDGSMRTVGKHVSTRVVCHNTLDCALGEGGGMIAVPHNSVFDHDDAKKKLGLVHTSWAGFQESIEALAERTISQDEAARFMADVYGDPDVSPQEQEPAVLKAMRNAWDAMLHSPGSDIRAARGTAWGALNGVTYLVDHVTSARSNDNRMASAWFGNGERIKNKAMSVAMKLVA